MRTSKIMEKMQGRGVIKIKKRGSKVGILTSLIVLNLFLASFLIPIVVFGADEDESNRAPQASDDTYEYESGSAHLLIKAPGVLENDSDPDGDELTVDTTPVVKPKYGTVNLRVDGGFTYYRDGGGTCYNCPDSFTYLVSDGELTAEAEVTILIINGVDFAPVAGDDSFETNKNQALEIAPVDYQSNDYDEDGDELTFALVNQPENGSASMASDGTITYTPNTDFVGKDKFKYSVSDGHCTVEATITINVLKVNNPPVAQDDEYTTDKNTPIDITDYMDNDSDPDGDVITLVQRISDPENGIVTDNEDGSFTYTPNQDFLGRDCFDYQITDGELTDVASICITIKDSDPGEPGDDNQPPVAKDDRYSTQKNRTLTVDPPGILVNDSDPDGDSIIVDVDTVSEPNHGTLTQKEDGSFIYTPDTNYTGTDTYTYRVFDGELYSEFATVTITIRPRSSGGGSSRDRDTDPRDTTPTPVDPDEPDEEDPPVIIPEPQPEPVPPVTPEPDPTPAPAPKPTSMPDPTPVSQAPPIRELPKTGANPLPMAGLGTLLVGLGFYIKRTSKNES